MPGNPGQYDLENQGIAWPKTLSQSFQENWATLAWKSRPVGTGDQGRFDMKIKANLDGTFRQTSQYFTFSVYQGKYSHIRQVETVGFPKAARLLHKRQKRPCDLITLSRSFVHPCSPCRDFYLQVHFRYSGCAPCTSRVLSY